MIKVVGTMFFKDNKLLIDKPRKRLTYQMIGGRVEDDETVLQAAIREAHEELGENAIFAVALLVNILAPIFDRHLALRPISQGGIRNAHKK